VIAVASAGRIVYISLILAFLSVSSCTSLQQRLSLKKCTFALTRVDIGGFTLSDLTLELYIAVTNHNPIDVSIDRMDLDFYIEDQKTLKVTLKPVMIQTHKTRTVDASLIIPYETLGMPLIHGIKEGRDIKYRLSGTVSMDTAIGAISFPVTILQN
jgi:LEA14-like dessication related protein